MRRSFIPLLFVFLIAGHYGRAGARVEKRLPDTKLSGVGCRFGRKRRDAMRRFSGDFRDQRRGGMAVPRRWRRNWAGRKRAAALAAIPGGPLAGGDVALSSFATGLKLEGDRDQVARASRRRFTGLTWAGAR